ncbi:glycoside hydrolase family 24 protein [Chitinimonas sp. BJB300]|uniref:glycoside hydrolase family 24 protein n=1 Tax=Chitinimonas sp. BJB300 TaxID=1559339 RepID=UPI000C122640|nr:glycoside hydrolase family 104 protein [Chitinimonas sp. BJB300]PHV10417.1 lysozyme [Chitinimonas sp. BJB300]TSJ88111.1 lysozyme [Chitinimonas sp. BJB300]
MQSKARISPAEAGGANVLAFLDMLAVSEGTALLAQTDDGYNVIVGSTPRQPVLFDSYQDHPRQLVKFPKLGIGSTAAGRYQLLARYYDAYRKQLGLSDFSPINQDRIAIQQIRERGALHLIQAGQIEAAIKQVKNIWASLPGAGYGQHEHSLARLLAAYQAAGGELAEAMAQP